MELKLNLIGQAAMIGPIMRVRTETLLLVIALVTLCFHAGCSTTNSRIKDHQAAFNSFSPQAQAQIQNGRIDRGFTEEMVFLAKGEPAEKSELVRGGKKVTIWKYPGAGWSAPTTQTTGGLTSPYGYPGFGPGAMQPAQPVYQRNLHKVEFENGKVVGWDPELQSDL